ncbi:MAG: response regulator [Chloroflexi bacterium]|nr:response regulator [Chloroflexota bacterium]
MKEKLLAVDDDPDILEALTMILDSQGYSVVTARDGMGALDRLKSEKPDLMILDLMMPKMDGFTVIRKLQAPEWKDHGHIPVLILTSIREDASRRRYELETGKELGVNDYIEKPFLPDILVARVEKALESRKKV